MDCAALLAGLFSRPPQTEQNPNNEWGGVRDSVFFFLIYAKNNGQTSNGVGFAILFMGGDGNL